MGHMEYLDIGNIIKIRRKELHITQEELCEGICEPVTISRIENGKQIPSINTLKAILERLDLPEEIFISLVPKTIFLNHAEFSTVLIDYDAFFQISNKESNISLEELKKEIQGLKCDTLQSKQLQFILLTTLDISNLQGNIDNLIQETTNYIKLTIPDFSEDIFFNSILDYSELTLILLLSTLHYFNNDLEISKKIINQLIYQLDSHFSFQYNSDLFIKFILIFMTITTKTNNKSDAHILGIYAKEQCIKYQKYKYLGNLYEHLYYCSESEEEKKEYLKKAYYMYVSTENQNGIQRIELINKDLNF